MKNAYQFTKFLSRDFSLPSVQAWVRGETANMQNWAGSSNLFYPYIIAERADDTIHFHYSVTAVEWMQNFLIKSLIPMNYWLQKV